MKWLTVFFLFFTFSAFAQIDTTIYSIVEEMPRFAGCEDLDGTIAEKKACADRKMLEYLYKNMKYPTFKKNDSLCTTLSCSFVVEKDGSVSNVEMLRHCENEAIKKMVFDVIYNFPNFESGKHRGIPVRVKFHLPIRIYLE